MNNMFSKFSAYDQIGYFLVGSIGLLVAYVDFFLLNFRFPHFSLTNLPVWIIVAYFVGHIIQAMANVFLKEKKDVFSDREKEILEEARTYFDLGKRPDREVWDLCNTLAATKGISGQVQTFNAVYSLYRGWTLVFVIESLFIAGCAIYSFSYLKAVLLLFSLVITALFYARWNRFHRYLRNKVLQTFIVIKTIKGS